MVEPLTTPGEFPPGGVVRVLEDAGHRVLRTSNEARSRLATEEELRTFGSDPALGPLRGRVVIEITRATYAARRRAEGKSPREIRRCIKRAVARNLFKLLQRLDRAEVEIIRVC